jgi:hypothetical protein
LGRPLVLYAAVVSRIVRERDAGATLQPIAEGLTADGVLTAHGRTTWLTSSVQAVLAGQDAVALGGATPPADRSDPNQRLVQDGEGRA